MYTYYWYFVYWLCMCMCIKYQYYIHLDCKMVKPVNPKRKQCWLFIGRTDAEAEAPTYWPPDVNCRFIRKDPDAGEDWRQEEKGMTEDELVGWHHRLNGVSVWVSSGRWWWTVGTGVLQPMGSQRVRHNWVIEQQQNSLLIWRRKWQPIPVFLPEEFHGQRNLMGYRPWGCRESQTWLRD